MKNLWGLEDFAKINLWGLEDFAKINLWGLEFCIIFALLKKHCLWQIGYLKEKYMQNF